MPKTKSLTRFSDIEDALREALNAPSETIILTHKLRKMRQPNKPAIRPPSITVVLSGRPSSGGCTVRLAHTTHTISEFEAKLEADKAARQAGLSQCVVLDVIKN